MKSKKSPAAGDNQKPSTREALLDATRELMVEENSTQVSFGDISQRSGINQALIRYHFGSKNGLLEALLERDAGSTFAALAELVASDIGAVEKLRRHIHGVIKIYHRFPYLNRLVGVLSADVSSETAHFISDRFARPLADAQRAILDQGIREGVFRSIDPMLFHFSLVGACDYLFHARASLSSVFGVDSISDDLRKAYADHICSILLESVRSHPQSAL